MKPICVACQRFYRPKKNGYFFVEGVPAVAGAPAGTAAPESWKPYKLWSGDLWECSGCGSLIVSGVGREPISEHFQKEFADNLRAYDARLQVNDCS